MYSTAVDVQFVVLALLCLFLVRYLGSKEISRDVQITCYVSWLLGFSGVILLPYDISNVLGSTNDDEYTRMRSLVDGVEFHLLEHVCVGLDHFTFAAGVPQFRLLQLQSKVERRTYVLMW
jgi:hypothetical protein